MKFPKEMKRLCVKCKKHTVHKVSQEKKRTAGTAKPLGKFQKTRTRYGKGMGNLGRYGSRPPINKFKMTGKKSSKKVDLRFTCNDCKKSSVYNSPFRAKKVEII